MSAPHHTAPNVAKLPSSRRSSPSQRDTHFAALLYIYRAQLCLPPAPLLTHHHHHTQSSLPYFDHRTLKSHSSPLPAMRASTPHSPSQPSPYERRSGSGPYAHPSTYPSPAKTEADHSNYMTPSMAFYTYSTIPLQSQALLPLSPHPSDNWTLSLASSMSPSMIDARGWSESYDSVGRSSMPSWEQQFQYAPSDSFGETVHSPAHSDGHIISQRSSVSSTYDHSLYSQDSSDSTFIKAEPYSDWKSDEDSIMGQQPLTVSPLRLRQTCSVPQRYIQLPVPDI